MRFGNVTSVIGAKDFPTGNLLRKLTEYIAQLESRIAVLESREILLSGAITRGSVIPADVPTDGSAFIHDRGSGAGDDLYYAGKNSSDVFVWIWTGIRAP